MVTYTLDNIEGIIFEHRNIKYKIYKSMNKMKYLDERDKFFSYDDWLHCLKYLNEGTHWKVIEQHNNIYELW